jgi:hypothetical protein
MRIIKLFILNTILFRGLEGSGSKIQKELIEKKRGRKIKSGKVTVLDCKMWIIQSGSI